MCVEMDPVSLLWAVVVCSSVIQGSSSVAPMFVQKGNDVLLNIMTAKGLEGDFDGLWKLNNSAILVKFYSHAKPKVAPVYTERVEFFVKNYSMKLKNLQDADSGVYTARVTGAEHERIVAEYSVTVQDPVSPVQLTADSVSSSSDSCNLNVTCSTPDHHVCSSFRCDAQTCSQEGGERSEVTTSGAFLHFYWRNDSIICEHSNEVSRTKNVKDIRHFCLKLADPHKEVNNITIAVAVCISLAIICLAAAVFRHWRRKYRRVTIENTIYDVARARATAQHPTDDTSDLSPNSIYSLAGSHRGFTQTGGQTLPESLYAQAQRPARS